MDLGPHSPRELSVDLRVDLTGSECGVAVEVYVSVVGGRGQLCV